MLNSIINIITFIGMLIFFTCIISLINSNTEGIINQKFGNTGRLLFSFIGTPVHELSHAFMCIIFRHRITGMRLLILNPESNIAGYVEHQYNKRSLYQNIGNFFIGTAPILCGFTIVTILYKLFMTSPKTISFWIALLICQQIIIHMRCSKADMMNSLQGALVFILIISLFGIIKPVLLQELINLIFKCGLLTILISGINMLFFMFFVRK